MNCTRVKNIALAVAGAVLFALAIAGLATAHEWYPPECCSGQDCAPASVDEVVEIDNGAWKHLPSGVVFSRDKVRPSKDSKFHVCIGNRPMDRGKAYCIFILQGT